MSLLGGKRPIKVQAARAVAKAAAKADCQATEGCGLPHAKLWEKGAAFMTYLEASRMKQENNLLDLVAAGKEKYPANLDLFLAASGPYQGHLLYTPEKWCTHPDNNKGKARKGEERLYTAIDSKSYRAASAYELGEQVLKEMKTYSEYFSKYLNMDGKLPSGTGEELIVVWINICVYEAEAEAKFAEKEKKLTKEVAAINEQLAPEAKELLMTNCGSAKVLELEKALHDGERGLSKLSSEWMARQVLIV